MIMRAPGSKALAFFLFPPFLQFIQLILQFMHLCIAGGSKPGYLTARLKHIVMKNKLQAAALIVIAMLVIFAAARSHEKARQNCSKEWMTVPGMHGMVVN
jgi:hypothetical protein